ncbi:MAG: glycoside hydrolase family 88 protein [Bacteroidales bacterium]|nr:glycoside hydrolase family 88 protein [Bacteroidales bacterium]
MKQFPNIILSFIMILSGCSAKDPLIDAADKVFNLAKTQYALMDSALSEGEYPRTTGQDGSLRTSDMGWWCSGFYPGSLWYIYEYTGDKAILEMAWKQTLPLKGLLDRHTDHDIGFQINCSFGNALRLTGDSAAVMPTYVAAAQKLAARLNPATGVTRSWDWVRKDWRYPVIIDNMMNMELLAEAARMSGDETLMDAATTHANTTLKNHFRPDWSCWHLLDYNPETGKVRSRETVQGYADESAWARGQAWALYGFTMMSRETSSDEYLDAAENIADMILSHLPDDGIPYWDFNAPDIPDALRDASAGAITASALIELSTITSDSDASERYLDTARKQLLTLSSEEYLAKPGENGFFLLKHCVGNMPENSEIDVPLSYADYYFLEALVRYVTLKEKE